MSPKQPEEQAAPLSSEAERYAMQLYTQRTQFGVRIDPAVLFKKCLAEAVLLCQTAADFRAGKIEVEEPKGPQLDWASCPNQPETHPHNLVSQQYGNLDDVRKINALVQKHNTSDHENFEPFRYKPLNIAWDFPTTRLAKHLFPRFCEAEAN